MPSSTPKYVIPYPLSSDTVASLATAGQNTAARLDLLLGESGVWTPTLVANTAASTAITLGRTYPGNASGSTPGTVVAQLATQLGSGVTLFTWTNSFTGTTVTVTGFTLGAICSAAGARTIYWRFIPAL